MTNDIQAIEKNFINAMGNGVNATVHLSTLFESSIVSHDFRPISNIINALNRKGDAAGSRVVRSVFALIFPDATVKKSKDKRSVVVAGGKKDTHNLRVLLHCKLHKFELKRIHRGNLPPVVYLIKYTLTSVKGLFHDTSHIEWCRHWSHL